MPGTVTRQVAGFTVVASTACPGGSECINALRCVEMGRKCVEGTSGCGGVPQNCCCASLSAPPSPPVPPAPPPEEVRIPTLIIVVAGVAVVGIAGLALWRLLRRS
jgi:hypothetical protein